MQKIVASLLVFVLTARSLRSLFYVRFHFGDRDVLKRYLAPLLEQLNVTYRVSVRQRRNINLRDLPCLAPGILHVGDHLNLTLDDNSNFVQLCLSGRLVKGARGGRAVWRRVCMCPYRRLDFWKFVDVRKWPMRRAREGDTES